MAITYYMLQINPVILFALMVASGAIAGAFATFFFRKYIRVKVLRSHNEVTGFLFLAIASFYALLLSFVVFVVWDQLNEIQSNVSKEGSSAMGLYRDIKYYPDTIRSKPLMTAYLDFVYNVLDEEFPNMAKMQSSRKTNESFSQVFYEIERLDPQNTFHIQLVSRMFNHLNELSTFRGLRTSSLEMEMPAPMWMPILLGAFITLLCSVLMDIEHKKMHVGLNSLLGAIIGMFLFIIILLDHPYTGSIAIQPRSYQQIFTLDQWENEHNTK